MDADDPILDIEYQPTSGRAVGPDIPRLHYITDTELARLKAEIARLRAALTRYGQQET